jgi:hypothetical protein
MPQLGMRRPLARIVVEMVIRSLVGARVMRFQHQRGGPPDCSLPSLQNRLGTLTPAASVAPAMEATVHAPATGATVHSSALRATVHARAMRAIVAASTRSSSVPSMEVPIMAEIPVVAEIPIATEVPIAAKVVPIEEPWANINPHSKERIEVRSVVRSVVRPTVVRPTVPVAWNGLGNDRCGGHGHIHAPRQQLVSTGCDPHRCITSDILLKGAEAGRGGRVHEHCGT